MESQKRLRASKILLAGLNGLGAEIAKNIILSGVKQVTFLDSKNVKDTDFSSQFFLARTSIGENRADASLIRAQALNPMVEIKVDKSQLSEKSDEFFHDFDVVCILEAPLDQLIRIDKVCRQQKVKFFAADLWGMFGYSFADLQVHEFVE
jgi:ubiquitin-like 1-activating enzyme E1 A